LIDCVLESKQQQLQCRIANSLVTY